MTTVAADEFINDARNRIEQASFLLDQALAALAHAAGTTPAVPYMDARTAKRVERVGEVAARHLAFVEQHGKMTVADSKAIRRQMYGDKVQSTANLFGTADSGALFYRPVPPDTPTRDTHEVRLTDDGVKIAKLWRAAHRQG